MAIVGFQDYWKVGARFLFTPDDIGNIGQPTLDLGTIQSVAPSLSVEKSELVDPDGGVKKVVDSGVTQILEQYDLTVNNMSLENWALMTLGSRPEDYSQSSTAAVLAALRRGHKGYMVKVVDAAGLEAYNLRHVLGVVTTAGGLQAPVTLTAINKATKTLTVGAPMTIADGENIIISHVGLANPANAGTYKVNGIVSSSTTIVVTEEPAADEAAITGAVVQGATQTAIMDRDDWEVVSLTRGLIRIKSTANHASFATGSGPCYVYHVLEDMTAAKRVIRPQGLKGEAKGRGVLILSRSNFAEQSAREFRCSITPSSGNLSVDDFSSMVLTVAVLSDIESEQDAGRMIQFIGNVPTPS